MDKITLMRLSVLMLLLMLSGPALSQNMENHPVPLHPMEARIEAWSAKTTKKLVETFSNKCAIISGQSISDCRDKVNEVICDASRRLEEHRGHVLKTLTNDIDSLSRQSVDSKLAFVDRRIDALYESATNMSNKCDKWLSIMTIVIAVLGVGMPLWIDINRNKNFDEIKKRSDEDAQKLEGAISDNKKLVDQISKMKREVDYLRIRNIIDQASARFSIFRSYAGVSGFSNYKGEDFRLAIADVSHAIVETMQLCEHDKDNKELFSSAVTCLHNIICGYEAMDSNTRKCGCAAMDKFDWKFDQKKLEECWTAVGLGVDKGNTILPSIGAFIKKIC